MKRQKRRFVVIFRVAAPNIFPRPHAVRFKFVCTDCLDLRTVLPIRLHMRLLFCRIFLIVRIIKPKRKIGSVLITIHPPENAISVLTGTDSMPVHSANSNTSRSLHPATIHWLHNQKDYSLVCPQISPSAANSRAMPSSVTAGQMRSQRFFRLSEPLAMQTLMPTTSVICRSLSLSPKPMVSASEQPR